MSLTESSQTEWIINTIFQPVSWEGAENR